MNLPTTIACPCTHTRLVRFTRVNGVSEVREQCQECGKKVRTVSSVGIDLAGLPPWDDHAKERLKRIRSIHKDEQKALWLTDYQAYLQSKQWAMLRALVIDRDAYKCQNCFRPVTLETAHVHHLSYEGYKNRGRSFAFEVITLCRGCHEAWHGR